MTGSFPAFGDAYLLLYEIYSKTGRYDDARQLSEEASTNSHLHESYRIRFSQLVQGQNR
jgi:hypothetical protein